MQKILETPNDEHRTPNEIKSLQWCESMYQILETSKGEHKTPRETDKSNDKASSLKSINNLNNI